MIFSNLSSPERVLQKGVVPQFDVRFLTEVALRYRAEVEFIAQARLLQRQIDVGQMFVL